MMNDQQKEVEKRNEQVKAMDPSMTTVMTKTAKSVEQRQVCVENFEEMDQESWFAEMMNPLMILPTTLLRQE